MFEHVDGQPVLELDDEQSWRLLEGTKHGRLVVSVAGEPDIFPVNYVVDRRSVVFRTAEGSKLFTLTVNDRVCFEVDGWDATGGWSVIVRGRARELTGHERDRAESLPLRPWVATRKTHWVSIEADEISGRQFHFGAEPEA